jgi:hypothetical protein
VEDECLDTVEEQASSQMKEETTDSLIAVAVWSLFDTFGNVFLYPEELLITNITFVFMRFIGQNFSS